MIFSKSWLPVRLCLGCCLVISVAGQRAAHAQAFADSEASESSELWNDLRSKSPWVFLGDSNTYSGGYIAVLEAWMREGGLPADQMPNLLNLGMSSETAAGTSEVDHPFKRPCIHERLEKVLAMTRPAVVFICYGMNDGIYAPLNDANMRAYQDGMKRLAQKVKEYGAELVCLTPPIFEPEPMAAKDKLGPSENGRYAYFAPARSYNAVVEAQAKWCLSDGLGARRVIDIHSMLSKAKSEAIVENAEFAFTKDGVHFGPEAHALVAEQILKSLGAPNGMLQNYPSNAAIDRMRECMILRRNAYLAATGKNRPGLPAGLPIWYAERMSEAITAR